MNRYRVTIRTPRSVLVTTIASETCAQALRIILPNLSAGSWIQRVVRLEGGREIEQ